MKICELELENFKAFKSEKFNFKKITILAGANSAGKSTVLNALASILQGRESRPFPFYFSNYGGNIHLGGFKDIVTGGNTSDKFGVGIRFVNGTSKSYAKGIFRYATNGQQILVDSFKIESDEQSLEVKWEGQKKGYSAFRKISEQENDEVSEITKIFLSSFTDVFSKLSVNIVDEEQKKSSIEEYLHKISKSSQDWEFVDVKKPSNLLSSLNESINYRLTIDRFRKSFAELSNTTSYIGPIRPYPSRHYYVSSYQDKIDSLGNNAFQFLIDWYKSDRKKYDHVIDSLKLLKLADSLSMDTIKDELVEMNVLPYGQKHTVNLSDVGFGLSQILPVLVANTVSEKGSTLLINQPEVHLHPSSQAELANYFAIESKNKNFVIETHSEYLINRLRLLVTEGRLDSDDVSILYIDNGVNGPVLNEISIAKNGALISAPESFFNTYYVDSKALVFASIGDEEDE